jgi:hypothetical protein
MLDMTYSVKKISAKGMVYFEMLKRFVSDKPSNMPPPKFIEIHNLPDYRMYEPKDLASIYREEDAKNKLEGHTEKKRFQRASKQLKNVHNFINGAREADLDSERREGKSKHVFGEGGDEKPSDMSTSLGVSSSAEMQIMMEKLLKDEKEYAARQSQLRGNLIEGNTTSRYNLPSDMRVLHDSNDLGFSIFCVV